MTTPMFGHRKRRTRQHVIADLSVHYAEGFILEEGHTTQRLGSDYGYDLLMYTFDGHGYPEPGVIYFQFKATEELKQHGSDYVFDLDIRDCNLWRREDMPVILVLFDAGRRRAFWLPVQRYFANPKTKGPRKHAKTVRVKVPQHQTLNRTAIGTICHLKQEALAQSWSVKS